ncbi:glycosyl transferase [Frankia sp. EI5c]|uniref:glycosyltransferase family 2 protein n=1 Tax=Frankia sp. EI5c TaxID=683316 RepID=UPI0007C3067C|nr:glycosyltransferase family 2 protein [Frankia sp. EI5c]OAA18307.1 glycosyl transferase [Frankia sp. EI5c]
MPSSLRDGAPTPLPAGSPPPLPAGDRVGQLTVPLQYRSAPPQYRLAPAEYRSPAPEYRSPAPGGRPGAPAGQPAVRVRAVAAMSRRQRRQYLLIVTAWLAAVIFFWQWWLRPGNIGSLPLFVLMSFSFCYVGTFLASMYLVFVKNMRRPVPIPVRRAERAAPIGRVAVISLTVPGSESLEIVRRQLVSMSRISYPHDSWILVDKVSSPEIEELARSVGVRYFSRHDEARWGTSGVAAWNRRFPPFQRRTKAGNVNSWLDAHGHRYTHFTQLDIDHIPNPDYLDRVLGYFADPKVKWVQAPSVYGNFEHWTARGAAEQELGLQGPLQMGFYGFSRTPFIIGSHCTYDTAAIQEIGGFQPTRAEDHLDTVCLAARGYQGVFVPDVIAVGDGPETFETYLSQQFAWAYSMIEVLLRHTPRLLRRYRPRQAVQFLFAQTWYTLWCLSMLALFALPLAALCLNTRIARIHYLDFVGHSLPLSAVAAGIWLWSRPWHVPSGMRLTWRGMVLHAARWVVVLSALVQVVLRVKKPYMITKKGVGDDAGALSLRLVVPYVALVLLPLVTCWFHLLSYDSGPAAGYLLFALQDALVFLLVVAFVLAQEIRLAPGDETPLARRLRRQRRPLLTTGVLAVATAVTAAACAQPLWAAVTAV